MLRRNQNKPLGFTIIELMVVVAIIGVLSSIAIVSYNGYVTKAKMSELLNVASTAKHAVSEYRVSTGGMPNSNAEAGINPMDSTFVESVTVGENGVVSISGNTVTLGLDAPMSIELTPSYSNGVVSWNCTTTGDNSFVPPDCRAATPGQEEPETQQSFFNRIIDKINEYYNAPADQRSALLQEILDMISEYFSTFF